MFRRPNLSEYSLLSSIFSGFNGLGLDAYLSSERERWSLGVWGIQCVCSFLVLQIWQFIDSNTAETDVNAQFRFHWWRKCLRYLEVKSNILYHFAVLARQLKVRVKFTSRAWVATSWWELPHLLYLYHTYDRLLSLDSEIDAHMTKHGKAERTSWMLSSFVEASSGFIARASRIKIYAAWVTDTIQEKSTTMPCWSSGAKRICGYYDGREEHWGSDNIRMRHGRWRGETQESDLRGTGTKYSSRMRLWFHVGASRKHVYRRVWCWDATMPSIMVIWPYPAYAAESPAL